MPCSRPHVARSRTLYVSHSPFDRPFDGPDCGFEFGAGREPRHPLCRDFHAVAALRVPHLPGLAVSSRRRSRSPRSSPGPPAPGLTGSLDEGVQRARGLRPGQTRIRWRSSNQVSLIHEAHQCPRVLSKAAIPVSIVGVRPVRVGIAQFAILPYRETADGSKHTVKLIAGILAVVLVAIIIMRRKKKKGATDDEF